MKICKKCSRSKNEQAFAWKNKTRGTKNARCKTCQAEYAKEHYLKNKRVYCNRARKRSKQCRLENQKQMLLYLSDKVCLDCGENDFRVLEFDHIDRVNKRQTVSSMVCDGYSWESILAEIEKCEIRCANCHRRRTFNQMNYYKGSRSSIGRAADFKPVC